MTAKCRFCGRSDGTLIYQPPSDDYIGGRRGYRQIGLGPSRYHQACLDDFTAFNEESKARGEREFKDQVAAIRERLAEEGK